MVKGRKKNLLSSDCKNGIKEKDKIKITDTFVD